MGFFSCCSLKLFFYYCPWFLIKKIAVVWIIASSYVMCCFFNSCFQIFSFIFGFQQFIVFLGVSFQFILFGFAEVVKYVDLSFIRLGSFWLLFLQTFFLHDFFSYSETMITCLLDIVILLHSSWGAVCSVSICFLILFFRLGNFCCSLFKFCFMFLSAFCYWDLQWIFFIVNVVCFH